MHSDGFDSYSNSQCHIDANTFTCINSSADPHLSTDTRAYPHVNGHPCPNTHFDTHSNSHAYAYTHRNATCCTPCNTDTNDRTYSVANTRTSSYADITSYCNANPCVPIGL